MADYIPHTDAEIESMLAFLGLASLDDLFSMVPTAMRLAGGLDMALGVGEFDVMSEMNRLADANRSQLVCFAGAGAYDHDVPAAVRRLASRTEFVTSYTPYQPEVAQGVLQALFEFQTMISRLSGLEVSNASLYDGATAAVEAVNLAGAATGRHKMLVSRGLHPNYRATLATMALGTGHELVDVPLVDDGGESGTTAWSTQQDAQDVAAVVIAYPNYLGVLDDMVGARALADRLGAKLIVAFDPVATGLLNTPGHFGADVAVGEGQAFGTPLSLGGPYLGLFACRLAEVRRLPGRLVGETVDSEGRRAYVTTLRTREQDIRREKASSNVCTNQTLIAVTAAISLSWLGTTGLREMALRCAQATRYTRDALLRIDGVESLNDAPTLREFAVTTPVASDVVVDRLIDEGFLAGVPLGDEYGGGLLVSVTEKRTRAEIDAYVAAFEKAVR